MSQTIGFLRPFQQRRTHQPMDPSQVELTELTHERGSTDTQHVTFLSPVISISPPVYDGASPPYSPDLTYDSPSLRRSDSQNFFHRSIDKSTSAGFAETSFLHKSFEIRASNGDVNLFATSDILPTKDGEQPTIPHPEHSCWAIERDLVIPKILYFIYHGSQVCLIPYFNIWYRTVGLSPGEIGTLAAVRQLMNLFGPPLFAIIADRFRVHKLVLVLGLLISLVGRLGMLPLGDQFILLLMLTAAAELFASLGGPMLDNMVLNVLTESRKSSFGRQRMWGTIAYASFATPVGIFVDRMDDANWYFYLNSGLVFLFVLVLIYWPVKSETVTTNEKKEDAPFSQGIKMLIGRFEGWTFFLTIGLIGVCQGLISIYLFLYLQDMDATPALLGLCLTTNAASVVPALFFSGAIIQKLTTQGGVLLACLAFCVRFSFYLFLPTPEAVLPAEALDGVTFGIMYACAVQIASSLAPPSMGATAQGILASVYNGCAAVAGVLGGLMYQSSVKHVWLLGIATASSGLMWYGFSVWWLRRKVLSSERGVYSSLQEPELTVDFLFEETSQTRTPAPLDVSAAIHIKMKSLGHPRTAAT
ncbi:major facilitator superfamily transporter [Planoprotostelium fungivorum]|uniref:Major facilitator superfamily transporter n=1 Tax=Planoprotostelium fungivorum TaxID=1890364 RepID=A0A2P6NJS9_9EUKA|nr:major facilitator superfamily transporter [Planoprotostelium fungivorum]